MGSYWFCGWNFVGSGAACYVESGSIPCTVQIGYVATVAVPIGPSNRQIYNDVQKALMRGR